MRILMKDATKRLRGVVRLGEEEGGGGEGGGGGLQAGGSKQEHGGLHKALV